MNIHINYKNTVFVNKTMGYDTQKELQRAAFTAIVPQYRKMRTT
jgi:hypothetical protein